jgi:hypothetical protein
MITTTTRINNRTKKQTKNLHLLSEECVFLLVLLALVVVDQLQKG